MTDRGNDLALVEAALFLASQPLTRRALAKILGDVQLAYVDQLLEDLASAYETSTRGIELAVEGGAAMLRVKRDYIEYVALQKCNQEIDKAYQDIQSGTEFAKAGENAGLEVISTDEINRSSYIRSVGRNPKVLGAVFSLINPGDITPPVKYDRGYVIIKLNERQSLDLTQYSMMRDSLQTLVLSNKQREFFNEWYTDLVESADIEELVDEYFSSR